MEFNVNYGITNVGFTMHALRHGVTVYHINKFEKADLMQNLLTWKVSLNIKSDLHLFSMI
jgi:hypothetical protein